MNNKILKLNEIKKENTLWITTLILLFLMFFIIGIFIPLTGDDFGNYSQGASVEQALEIARSRWYTLEGRFVSRFLIIYLTPRKVLWSIINSASIVAIIYFVSNIINKKNKLLSGVIVSIGMVCMNYIMYRQTYWWIAGSCTYLLGIPLILCYFNYMNKIFTENMTHKWYSYIGFAFINFIATMYIENMGVALVVANILYLIYEKFKNKKLDKLTIVCTITSIIGLSLMLFAPGVRCRAGMTPEFEKMSLVQKIIFNIPNFTYFTTVCNTITLILMTLFTLKFLVEVNKNVKNVVAKISTKFVFCSIMILNTLSVVGSIFKMFPFSIKEYKTEYNLLPIEGKFVQAYIIVFLIIFIAGMIYYAVKKEKWSSLFYTLVAFASLGVMLPIATWGERVALFYTVVMFIPLIDNLGLNKLSNKKIVKVILFTILIANAIIYLNVYYSVFRHKQYKEDLIKSDIQNELEEVRVSAYPYTLLWNAEPWNEYHEETFKNYYGFKENQKPKIIHGEFSYKSILADLLNRFAL